VKHSKMLEVAGFSIRHLERVILPLVIPRPGEPNLAIDSLIDTGCPLPLLFQRRDWERCGKAIDCWRRAGNSATSGWRR